MRLAIKIKLRFFFPLFLLIWLIPVQAGQEVPYNLVCFSEAGLKKVLREVQGIHEFLSNRIPYELHNKQGCSYVQVPSGSVARLVEFHQTGKGFIFPIFQVRYSTTHQKMYSSDGMFLARDWEIGHGRRKCGGDFETCLRPRSCEALEGVIGRQPEYVQVPRECRRERITYPQYHRLVRGY